MWAPRKNHGFTIVELLIVVVIIGILAAIVIVAYNGITGQAHDRAVQSDLRNIANIVQQQHIENGTYPTSLSAAMGIKMTKDSYSRGYYNGTSWYNLYYCRITSGTNASFGLVAESKSGARFQYVGGSVSPYGYALASSTTTCSRLGIDTSDSNYGVRFMYNADAWAF